VKGLRRPRGGSTWSQGPFFSCFAILNEGNFFFDENEIKSAAYCLFICD